MMSQEERTVDSGMRTVLPVGTFASQYEVVLAIDEGSEFKPTYDWQFIRGWSTVPSGAETRLPLSKLEVTNGDTLGEMFQEIEYADSRQVRIPNPYQLQLRYPKPCKYFFRANVFRDSLVSAVEAEANDGCRRFLAADKECLYFLDTSTGLRLTKAETASTVEQADLFNRQLELRVDSNRSASGEDCTPLRQEQLREVSDEQYQKLEDEILDWASKRDDILPGSPFEDMLKKREENSQSPILKSLLSKVEKEKGGTGAQEEL